MREFYRHKVMVAAHRGNSKYFPENTMPAFESAVALNVDMIELDLHMTKDGEIIIMHNHTVDKTTNGTGSIMDLTYEEIRRLDAGSWKGAEFSGAKVPTFREFLDLVKDRKDMMLNIELKDYPHLQGERAYASCDKSIALMEEYGISERSVINSWSGQLLEYVDQKYDGKYRLHGYYPISLMGEGLKRDPFEYVYCMCLFSQNKGIPEKEAFDYVAGRGVEPWVFCGHENPEIYAQAVQNGALLFTVNDPKKADEILKDLGVR